MHHRLLLVCSLVLLTVASLAEAAAKVDRMFSDHMVLQRDMPVPVWGTADAGEKVAVSFRGQSKETTADKDGKWHVKLDAMKVGKPGKLTVAASNSVSFDDVVVGEVWIGSGQSNMAGSAGGYAKRDKVLAELISSASNSKLRLFAGGKWATATPENASRFSALCYAFGYHLQDNLDVPVGLMVGAVGGTPSGLWLTEDMLKNDAACQRAIADGKKNYDAEAAKKNYEAAIKKWEAVSEQFKKEGKRIPRKPNPPVGPGECNRGKIGGLYDRHIRPFIGYGIRGVLWDQGESGTAIVGVDQFDVMGALIKGWRADWKQGEFPFLYVQKYSGGNSAFDTNNPVTALAEKFAALPAKTNGDNDGVYRELHIRIMQHPNTAMVTASDLGSGIHPINKSSYGHRAAQVARGMVYGEKVAIYGPVFESFAGEGNDIRVKFKHVGQGLVFKHGEKLQGFEIASKGGPFHWADAKINGDTVVVSSDKVVKPFSVRYGWARSHPWANLFNKDGLPALAFRAGVK